MGHRRPRRPLRAPAAECRRRGRAARPRAPAPRAAAAPQPAQRPVARAPQHLVPLRPRQRALRADARRDDDLLVRDLRVAGAVARRRAARKVRAALPRAEARTRGSRARDRLRLGRLRRARRHAARLQRHRPDDLARAGDLRPHAHEGPPGRDPRAGLPADRGAVHEGRLDRDGRGDRRRPVRDVFRDDRPGARSRRARSGAEHPRPRARWDRYRTTPDWIERYVFPGCLIPSLESLTRALKGTTLAVYGVEEIGEHYAETLRRWRRNVHEQMGEVRALGYDRRFERTWDFYLSFCEAGFRMRWLRDAQLLLARSG